MFSGEELGWFIARAHYVALNDYEAKLMCEKTGLDLATLSKKVEALIVTRGGQGSEVWRNGEVRPVPVAPVRQVVDPTGCGDAYRAGLLYGLAQGLDWDTIARLAAVMGGLKIEQSGAQNHTPDRQQIADRFVEGFGYRPW
jgi:adenosine kinase